MENGEGNDRFMSCRVEIEEASKRVYFENELIIEVYIAGQMTKHKA